MGWDDYVNQVIRIRRVKISTLDDAGQPINEKFAVMAECSGHVSISEMHDSLPDLVAVLNQYKGLVEFLYRTACSYMDEDDLKEIHQMLGSHPELRNQIHMIPIFSRQDEEKADYIEMGPGPIGMDQSVPPRLHESLEEPEYRKRS